MQSKFSFYFHFIFLLVVVGDLIGAALQSQWMDYIFKPLLLPCLMYFLWIETKQKQNLFIRMILVALLFSWLGDVFLMFENGMNFILGLLSFLVSHLLYVYAYILSIQNSSKLSLIRQKPYFIIPFLIYLGIFFSILFPNLGDLQIPVLIYAIVLISMGLFALNRYKIAAEKSFWLIFSGALSFIASDSCLAINKFLFAGTLPWAGVVIMATYILAQYLIVQGSIAQVKS